MSYYGKVFRKMAASAAVFYLLVNAGTALAADKNSDEKAYLGDVYQNMMEVKSLHYEAQLDVSVPIGKFQGVMIGDAQEEPLCYQHDLKLLYCDEKKAEHKFSAKQYIEENEGVLTSYLQTNDKWIKQTMPITKAMHQNMSRQEQEAALKSMLGMIKNVSLEKETPAYKYMEVTLDAVKISDAVEAAVKQEDKKQPAEVERGFAIGRLALLAAGDIKYQVIIDKASQTIRELNMDLTEPIRKGTDLFVTAGSPKDRQQIQTFLAQSTLTLQVKYSNYNAVANIVIPQQVKDQAVETKPSELPGTATFKAAKA